VKRYAWFAAAALAAVALWRGIAAVQPKPPEPDIAAMPMLARDPRRADRIQIVHGDARLELERRGQLWCLAQNGGYPIKPDLGQRLIDQLLALQLTHPAAPPKPDTKRDEPKDPHAALTGIRVLATNGAGLGAIIVADHDASATTFQAHQLGDPRDWQAAGALAAPADPLAWVDSRILRLDPAVVTGATLTHGADSIALDAADAADRLKMLEGLAFTDVHPVAQIPAAPAGRLTFTLDRQRSLTVEIRTRGDQTWLAFQPSAPGLVDLPTGAWLFRYPAAAAALLQPAP
jgi:hypothetical protein